MAVYRYDVDLINDWRRRLNNCLENDTQENSLAKALKEYVSAVDSLIADGTWEGPSAEKAFTDFSTTYNAFIDLKNAIRTDLDTCSSKMSSFVNELLSANASGVAYAAKVEAATMEATTAAKFAKSAAAHANDVKEVYDTDKIAEANKSLSSLKDTTLPAFQTAFDSIVGELGSGNGMFDTPSSASLAENLKSSFGSAFAKVLEGLGTCVSNTTQALANATGESLNQ